MVSYEETESQRDGENCQGDTVNGGDGVLAKTLLTQNPGQRLAEYALASLHALGHLATWASAGAVIPTKDGGQALGAEFFPLKFMLKSSSLYLRI